MVSISDVNKWPELLVPQRVAGTQSGFPHICRAVATAKKHQKEKSNGRQPSTLLSPGHILNGFPNSPVCCVEGRYFRHAVTKSPRQVLDPKAGTLKPSP